MRQILFIQLLLGSIKGYSQKVMINGIAFDTTNGRNWVHVVVNDTLRKFRDSKMPNWDNYKKLIDDTTVHLFAKKDGKYRIMANKTDSIFFQSLRHIQKVYCVSDLLKMKEINIKLDPEICNPYVGCQDTLPSKFYIFVGQKLKVVPEKAPYYCNVITMDSKIIAEYKILKQVVGNFPKDTIVFASFNHNHRITFFNYEIVLLFVSEYCGELYHERYQFFDLYKTVNGNWASPGDPYKYDEYRRKDLKAQNIQFADSVWFDISKLNETAIKQQYPFPFYKIEGQKAIPIMGSYIDELIAVKKETVFKARKIAFD